MPAISSFPLSVQAAVPESHWDGSNAADIFAPCGTPALAVFDGVASPGDFALGGHTVFLQADDGEQAYYAHMRSAGRASGRVRAGDVVGYVSNTGNANKRGDGQEHDDECHLHFALGQIDGNGAGTIVPAQALAGVTATGIAEPGSPPAVIAGLGGVGDLVNTVLANPWPWLAAAAALAWSLDLI